MTFLYALWLLLNIALAIGLLVGWYRCLQLFARQYSRSASLALCVVTLMTCAGSRESLPETAHLTAIAPSDLVLNPSLSIDHRLLDLPLAHLSQRVGLNPPSQSGDSVRVTHSVVLTGLQTGLRWQPVSLIVGPRPDRQLHYNVVGVLEWRLLNTTVYRQPVSYTGLLAVDTLPSRL